MPIVNIIPKQKSYVQQLPAADKEPAEAFFSSRTGLFFGNV